MSGSSWLPASRTHLVCEGEALGRFVRDRGLRRLESILDQRGFRLGEWLAEHASAQLCSASGCESKPQWAAWCTPHAEAQGPSAPPDGDIAGLRVVVLWAEDSRAARRAVVALQLQRACPVSVLLSRAFLVQLERCACEAESGSIDFVPGLRRSKSSCRNPASQSGSDECDPFHEHALSDVSPWPNCFWQPLSAFEAWGSLFEVSGDGLADLRARREAAAEADVAETRRKISDLSRALLALDPDSTIEVELEQGRRAGRHALVVQGCIDGHNVSWGGPIDKFASIADTLRAIRASCGCC